MSQVDALWSRFRSGGINDNPVIALAQMNFLAF
jgi:hypothetical protein